MSPKLTSKHAKMPPRMVKRQWSNKKGSHYAYYYEHPRDETGKRILEPLGTDFSIAKRKWGEIEAIQLEEHTGDTLGAVYEKYMKWAENTQLSQLSPRTIKDRKYYWKQLEPVFATTEMNAFKSSWCLKYFENRSSQISAKKELKFLSIIFNWATARDLCNVANPVTPISRQLRVSENRDILITADEFTAVQDKAVPFIQDLMDLMFMAGTRPDEAIYIKFSDIKADELVYEIKKTSKRSKRRQIKRVKIGKDLRKLIDRRRKLLQSQNIMLIDPPLLFDEKGNRLTLGGSVRNWWKKARDAAQLSRRYQLKDIRPYAATERFKKEGMEATRRLLGHSTESQTRTYIREYLGEETESHDSVNS